MKKRTQIIALLLALVMTVGLMAGCGQSKKTEEPAANPTQAPAAEAAKPADSAPASAAEAPAVSSGTHTVVDVLGRELEVPDNPQRIAVCATVLPNLIYALQGHMNNVYAMDESAYSGWENSMLRYMAPEVEGVDTSMMPGDYTINVESAAEADIDLVLTWDSEADMAEKLAAVGIPCVLFTSATNLETLEALIEQLGETLNCQERAAQALQWYKDTEDFFAGYADQIAALGEDAKPRVLNFQRASKTTVYGKGINANITDQVGGIAYRLPAEVSSPTVEDLISFDPEIIFISNFDDTTPDDFYENRLEGQDWSAVSAVVNHRVYKVPSGLYRWAPPNTFEKPFYMRWMASMIQPEIFSEIDMRAELKQFYHDFYNFDLTEEMLDEIFRADLNRNSQ
jgi:iron complex transport system substrate-binding protein